MRCHNVIQHLRDVVGRPDRGSSRQADLFLLPSCLSLLYLYAYVCTAGEVGGRADERTTLSPFTTYLFPVALREIARGINGLLKVLSTALASPPPPPPSPMPRPQLLASWSRRRKCTRGNGRRPSLCCQKAGKFSSRLGGWGR